MQKLSETKEYETAEIAVEVVTRNTEDDRHLVQIGITAATEMKEIVTTDHTDAAAKESKSNFYL